MKIGAIDYHFRGRDDTERFLLARRLGVDGVEVMVGYDDLVAPDQERLAQLRAARLASGLPVSSLLMGGFNTEMGIAWPEADVAARAREAVRRATDWAAELDAPVVLVPFFVDTEIRNEEDFGRAVAAFKDLCPYAAARGVVLGLESTLPSEDVLRMMREVGEPGFGCYFDTGNTVFQNQDAATEIRMLGSAIKMVHLKDTTIFPGDARMGEGVIDFAACAEALEEIGYDGWLIGEFTDFPETGDEPAPPPEVVAREISFTRSMFPRLRPARPWPQIGATSAGWRRGQAGALAATFKQLGLGHVRLAGELLDEALGDTAAAAAMRAELEASGVLVAGLSTRGDLVSPDPAVRRETLALVKACLELAPRLGTSVVTMPAGADRPAAVTMADPPSWSMDYWEPLCQAVAELLPVAQAHGAIMAFKVNAGHTLPTESLLAGLLDRFPTKHVLVELDPYSFLARPQMPALQRVVVRYLERFEPMAVAASLRDFGSEGLLPFGSGTFPHRVYLEFLRSRRPDLPLIFEGLDKDTLPGAVEQLQLG